MLTPSIQRLMPLGSPRLGHVLHQVGLAQGSVPEGGRQFVDSPIQVEDLVDILPALKSGDSYS